METKHSPDINWRQELHRRTSYNRLTGEPTTLRILAGPGGRNFYNEEIRKRDRIIYIELSRDGVSLEFPLTVLEQEKIWEHTFDVWVQEKKIVEYANRFLRLIHSKLAQRKLAGMAKVYMVEKEPRQ